MLHTQQELLAHFPHFLNTDLFNSLYTGRHKTPNIHARRQTYFSCILTQKLSCACIQTHSSIQQIKGPTDSLGFIYVILVYSGHQHVLANPVSILRVVTTRTQIQIKMYINHANQFTVQITSSLTHLDHNSPPVSFMYVIPQNYTANNNFKF